MEGITLTSDITVTPIDQYGGDWLICDAARVSTKGTEGQGPRDLTKADKGLIRALVRGRHGAPFQHSGLTFFVEAPIFVFREWRTHRIYMNQTTDDFSYSEQSARYRGGNPKFWIPSKDRPMIKGPNFKAMAPEFERADAEQLEDVWDTLRKSYKDAWESYQYLVGIVDVAPEVARSILPVGMYSSMYVSTNVRSLSHFLSLRTHEPDAKFVSYPQLEIEEAARQAETLFANNWPETYQAWNESGRHSL